MNILYLSSVRIPSEKASGLAIVRQCQAFASLNHKVELIIPERGLDSKKTIESEYGMKLMFTTKYVKSKGIFSFGKIGFGLMQLYESIRMFSYFLSRSRMADIVYSRDQRILLPFIFFGFSERCYVELHTAHKNFVTRYTVGRAKKVIVISEGLKEHYQTLSGRKDIQVEPSGVDLEQFKNLPETSILKNTIGLPVDKMVFGYVGKFSTMGESKGVEDIIFAFALAFQSNKNLHLFLVGVEDNERDSITCVVEKAGLPPHSYTIVALDQKSFSNYLTACDVLLMNYPDTEHYAKYMSPTKLFAYMATGKPVISSDLPSVLSIHMEGVLFVPANDKKRYARAIIEAAEKYELISRAAKINTKLTETYSWDNRAVRILGHQQDVKECFNS